MVKAKDMAATFFVSSEADGRYEEVKDHDLKERTDDVKGIGVLQHGLGAQL
jgi:hypothetical protein